MLLQLSGDGDPAAAAQRYVATDTAPKLIPRIIHQTYKTGAVPERVAQFMRTWVAANPGWCVAGQRAAWADVLCLGLGQLPWRVQRALGGGSWAEGVSLLTECRDVRFYDDHDCLDFVKREFPEYLDAYRRLSKDVERSDFFRWVEAQWVAGGWKKPAAVRRAAVRHLL